MLWLKALHMIFLVTWFAGLLSCKPGIGRPWPSPASRTRHEFGFATTRCVRVRPSMAGNRSLVECKHHALA